MDVEPLLVVFVPGTPDRRYTLQNKLADLILGLRYADREGAVRTFTHISSIITIINNTAQVKNARKL